MSTNPFIIFRSICTFNEVNKQTHKIGVSQMMIAQEHLFLPQIAFWLMMSQGEYLLFVSVSVLAKSFF